MTAARTLMRMTNGVEERLCWRFRVPGRAEPKHEPANGQHGPYDPDRLRHLRPGETFQRLGRSGHPCHYQGLFWQPTQRTSPIPLVEGPAPAVIEDA
ncbi:MAG: hypothetical protein QM820_20735 [Minicystis sp.]